MYNEKQIFMPILMASILVLGTISINTAVYADLFTDLGNVKVDVRGDGKNAFKFGIDFEIRIDDDASSRVDFQAKEDDEIKLDQGDKVKVKFDLDGAEGGVAAFLAEGKTFIFDEVEPDTADWITLHDDNNPTDNDFKTKIPKDLDDGDYQFIIKTEEEEEDNIFYYISDAEVD